MIHNFGIPGQWPVEKAARWAGAQPWLVGCNFLPSTAINQLEMWQTETYDRDTITRELGWAEGLGFNVLRVYLHDILWTQDPGGLHYRMDDFLAIAAGHGMRVLFVFFDDCHRPDPKPGPQPPTVRGFHNSGWVVSPARELLVRYACGRAEPEEAAGLKNYVQNTLDRFRDDHRVVAWELFNEPGRDGADLSSLPLLLDAWRWAREVAPSQPICSTAEGSLGDEYIEIARANSDVLSFHCYSDADLEGIITTYQPDGRPLLCTEYLARPDSTFERSLPILKAHRVAAINWGLVSGKSGTVWPWSGRDGKDVWALREQAGEIVRPGEPFPEPDLWFHDIFRTDGTPFRASETVFLRKIIRGE